jgi:hypothetical protein
MFGELDTFVEADTFVSPTYIMDETIPDVGLSIGTIQRKKPVSKDTNPETFWNNFDKIISITKLKLENPIWGPVKMASERVCGKMT